MSNYQFQPVTEAYRTFLLAMLAEPHVAKWWGDAKREWNLIVEGEASGESRGFVVERDNQALGYVQCWIPNWDKKHVIEEPWQADIGPNTLGVNISLGTDGLGHGAAIVRAFAAKLFAEGTARLTIDPDLANVRAIRAYEKAGFRVFDTSYCESHAVLLMDLTSDGHNATQ